MAKKTRRKRNSELNIKQIDNDWMMEKAREYNARNERVSVEMLVRVAKEERRENFKRHLAESDWDGYVPNYPPGKDKMQEIVRRWIEDGIAVRNMKHGIILKSQVGSKRLPKGEKTELIALRNALKTLNQVRKYKKKDFLRHYALKQSLAALPTRYWLGIRNKESKHHIFVTLLDIVSEMMGNGKVDFPVGKKINKIDGLSLLIKKQAKMWKNKNDFKRICGKADLLVSGTGSDQEIAVLQKDLKLYLRN